MTSTAAPLTQRPVPGDVWLRRMSLADADARAALGAGSVVLLGLAIGGYVLQRGYSTIMTVVPLVDNPGYQNAVVRYGPMAALVGATVLARPSALVTGIDRRHRWWLALLALWGAGLALAGLAGGNPRYYLLLDTEVLVVLLCGILLGAQRRVWSTIDKAYTWVFAAAVPIVLLGLSQLDMAGMRFGGKFTGVAYDSQYLLWPAAFFLLCWRAIPSGRTRTIVLIAFGMCLLEQVLFQKRAPTGRLLLSLGLAILLTLAAGGTFFRRIAPLAAVLVSAALAVSVLAAILGLSVPAITDAFLLRLTDARGQEAASLDNARFGFAAHLLSSLDGLERWFGRGLGGYLVDSTYGYYILTTEGVMARGAAAIEIGHTWAFLKGGFAFLVVLNLPFAAALLRGLSWCRLDARDRAAWAFVAVTTTFLFAESLLTHPNQLYWLLAAAAAGRLVAARPPQRSTAATPLRVGRGASGLAASSN